MLSAEVHSPRNPAAVRDKLKWLKRYSDTMLATVSSTPKQAA
jgi:hypothetical protein